jgi:putative hydrolase of the HAD superfamily
VSARDLALERFREYLGATRAVGVAARRMARSYETELSKSAHTYPACRAVLRALGRRYRLGVVTNGLTRIQTGRLRASGLDACFETVVTSEACGFAKPDPRILHVALERLDVRPADALYVGDDPAVDYAAARAARVPFVWVDRGRHRPSGALRPARRVRHLRELLTLLV